MEEIIREIEGLKNNGIGKIVDSKIKEFESFSKKSNDILFKEMCFCILAANFTAERAFKIQKAVGNGFLTLSEKQLAKELKKLGHRFPNSRAKHIVMARTHKDNLKEILRMGGEELRKWLVDNVMGLGYKEASHFLRNIGKTDYAIIDFHIIDVLAKHNLIEAPKTVTKKKYLEIEAVLQKIAQKTELKLGELDLYLWYLETGKILK
ncbi:TPA: N-glycosylase/DNA lyase [archaeon]|nr:N-glycosylase/DNA lyase [Candidatus Naiadarchaeales archaeon SRR2090159.bin1288]